MSNQQAPGGETCPQCGSKLTAVTYSGGYLNRDQWESQRAGDWYCPTCPPNDRSSRNLYCYWWNREVQPTAPPSADDKEDLTSALTEFLNRVLVRLQDGGSELMAAELSDWLDLLTGFCARPVVVVRKTATPSADAGTEKHDDYLVWVGRHTAGWPGQARPSREAVEFGRQAWAAAQQQHAAGAGRADETGEV